MYHFVPTYNNFLTKTQQRQISALQEEAQIKQARQSKEMNSIQITLQEREASIQKLQQQISCQKDLIEQQATDLSKKSDHLNDLTIFVEQLIEEEEKRRTHMLSMRLGERKVEYLQKHAEELASIRLPPQKVSLHYCV